MPWIEVKRLRLCVIKYLLVFFHLLKGDRWTRDSPSKNIPPLQSEKNAVELIFSNTKINFYQAVKDD